jgi:hypothetical protein
VSARTRLVDWLSRPPLPRTLPGGLVAAARTMRVGGELIDPQYERWQDEAWGYYDRLGEYRFAVQWLAGMISRIRLVAARPGEPGDEPETVLDGPAAAYVAELAGGIGGQAEMLDTLASMLTVVGEGWIVGEGIPGAYAWQVRSADEIRKGGKVPGQPGPGTQVLSDASSSRKLDWRTLPADSLVVRVWRPHKRLRYLADSPTHASLGALRELDLNGRYIQAVYLSRLASAGMVLLPNEATLPGRDDIPDDAPDPFVWEWIEVAREAIANPGSASAVVPIPMRLPADLIDKPRYMDFTTAMDEQILDKRESALKRLATGLDLPAEVLTGLGSANHWTAWQIEEQALKAHIAPPVELICHSLTVGYLAPRLVAAGQDPSGFLVWYDPSELTVRPDRSADAVQLYDRAEITGDALRRETGFDASDAPDDQAAQILAALARNPSSATWAYPKLTGEEAPAAEPGTAGGTAEPPPVAPATGPPGTRNAPPPAPNGSRPR